MRQLLDILDVHDHCRPRGAPEGKLDLLAVVEERHLGDSGAHEVPH